MKLKLATVASIKKALASLTSAGENFKGQILALAKKELESGMDAADVIRGFLAVPAKGSWEAQEIARALKADETLLAAGLAAKIFRMTGKVGPRAKTKAKASAGKGGKGMSLSFANGEALAKFLLASMTPEQAMDIVTEAVEAIEAAAEAAEKATKTKAPAKKAK